MNALINRTQTDTNLTPEKKVGFAAVLAECCNVGRACASIGIGRSTAYRWREQDTDFAQAWEEAIQIGVSALEDEVHRRAFEGVDDPLTHQGRFTYLYRDKVGDDGEPVRDPETGVVVQEPVLDENGNHKVAAVRKYSDTLAIFLLKAHNPDKYRENSKVELAGQLALGSMTEDEMRAELAMLAASGLVFTQPDGDVADLL